MKELTREQEIYRVTITGSIGNFILLVFKFVAGILGHSAAMVADAVHSLSDFITDIIVLVFVRISSKPHDEGHDYGHGKYETLATMVISIILFCAGAALLLSGMQSILRFMRGETLASPRVMALIAALVSIAVKEALYWYTVAAGRKVQSKAVEANAWHHRSDAMSSIGTAIGIGGAILLGEKWHVLDPIAAVIVSVFILVVAVKLLMPSVNELLEQSLPRETEDKILSTVAKHTEVDQPHNLRTRRIGNYAAVDLHVRMDPDMTVAASHSIVTSIEREIMDLLGKGSIVNIHVEPRKSNQNNLGARS